MTALPHSLFPSSQWLWYVECSGCEKKEVPMAERSIEKELMHLETQYWEAIKTKDFEKALSMTDDPCLVVGPRGVDSVDREKFRSMMKSQTHSLRNFELKDAKVHPLTEDVAVLAYNIREDL